MSDRHAPSSAPTHDDVLRLRPDAPPPAPRALPPAKPPRIEEVARLAGVSPITVSRALRQPEKVAKDKRERILQVVAQTGYASNPHARALRSGQSSVVAAFVSNIFSQQFALAVQGCAEVLEPQGYQLMVGQTSYSYAKETSMIASLRALRPAAVLFTGVIELEENRQSLRELGIPIMETWAYPRDPIDMLVGLSNYDAGFMAASHLAERGYRRVAFMARHGGRGELRRQGFAPRRAARAGGRRRTGRGQSADHRRWPGRAGPAAVARRQVRRRVLRQRPAGRRRHVRSARPQAGRAARSGRAGLWRNRYRRRDPARLTTIGVDSLDLGRRAGEMLLQRLGGGMPAHPHQVMPLRIHARASV